MRVLTEIVHVLIGIVVAIAIGSLAAWAVPRAAATIWMIDYVAIAVVLALGVPALRTARAADLADRAGHRE